MSEKLIEKKMQDCPICNQKHLLEKWQRDSEAIVKDTTIQYQEVFFRCTESYEEENEFASGSLLNENLLRARDAYRLSKGLLTSIDIAKIRTKYGMTQSDFAFLMGWGEVTITRYESKTIQDETYDEMMRLADQNPLFALKNLERHKANFSEYKYSQLRDRITQIIEDSNPAYLKKQEVLSLYINHRTLSVFNGFKQLDFDIIGNIIEYYANNIPNLFKVKLMKLLWYTDVLYYKEFGKALTGLVYQHKTYGALPIGYHELIFIPSVNIEEIQYHNGSIIYHIVPKTSFDGKLFSEQILSILNSVIEKFKDFTTQQIVEYMHQEKAYYETSTNQLISFEYAQYIDETRNIDNNNDTKESSFDDQVIDLTEF